jgi:hypothetical protein
VALRYAPAATAKTPAFIGELPRNRNRSLPAPNHLASRYTKAGGTFKEFHRVGFAVVYCAEWQKTNTSPAVGWAPRRPGGKSEIRTANLR